MTDKTEYVVVYAFTVHPGKTWVPLILKNKPPHLEGMLNLPGGKIEPGEDPIAAALRELKEETGLEEVQEYDPMIYCPAEYMGKLDGGRCIIHAVKVPVVFHNLKPRSDETEVADWYSIPELYNLPNLMPNLRVMIPLMAKDLKGWLIQDFDNDWRKQWTHSVSLSFDDSDNPWNVEVRSVGHYNGMEEEE